mmetsp:Transcript_86572/g.225894  ORF Transcript_86572/g.225894 Transcript_86572/m.225894 type:complete len:232 (+) Transcript_86572:1685-2380(+)
MPSRPPSWSRRAPAPWRRWPRGRARRRWPRPPRRGRQRGRCGARMAHLAAKGSDRRMAAPGAPWSWRRPSGWWRLPCGAGPREAPTGVLRRPGSRGGLSCQHGRLGAAAHGSGARASTEEHFSGDCAARRKAAAEAVRYGRLHQAVYVGLRSACDHILLMPRATTRHACVVCIARPVFCLSSAYARVSFSRVRVCGGVIDPRPRNGRVHSCKALRATQLCTVPGWKATPLS